MPKREMGPCTVRAGRLNFLLIQMLLDKFSPTLFIEDLDCRLYSQIYFIIFHFGTVDIPLGVIKPCLVGVV